MNALTTTSTFCPSSFQLKLALNRRKYPLPTKRTRLHDLDRCKLNHNTSVLVRSSAVNGNGVERRSSGNSSWVKSSNSADSFSGWANADGERQSDYSNPKQSLAGILGVGAAGVVLVAGLTFAALSISNRSTPKGKQEMEPLTTQQEKSLSSDNYQDRDEEEKLEILDSGGEESKTSTSEGPSLDKENIEANENNISDDSGVRQLSEDGYVAKNGFIQKAPQNESAVSDDFLSTKPSGKPPSSDITDGLIAVPGIHSIALENLNDPETENLVDYEPLDPSIVVLDTNSETLIADTADGISSSNQREISDSSVDNYYLETSIGKDLLESELDAVIGSSTFHEEFTESGSTPQTGEFEPVRELSTVHVSLGGDDISPETQNLIGTALTGAPSVPEVFYQSANGQQENNYNDVNIIKSVFDSTNQGNVFSSAGIPAPSLVSAALQAPPGKVLVPAAVDQLHSQALSALQVLKVIEDDVRPGDLCSRREYARWLVSASSVLSRNTTSKVYPAMYIENVSELAFDDITPEDPDFPFIQGLAEAGLIASKLSRRDMQSALEEDSSPFIFSPESPLSRQDLVSWKMALEKRQLPVVDRETLQQLTGFIDIDKIDPDAWPSLVADLAVGEQGIITLAFGYTRLFQPDKPVTNAQAAIALSTGDASTMVSEELARIEAESMAEKAVAAHNALVSQVEKDLNANYAKELSLEKEKNDAVQKLAEDAKREVEKLRAEREEQKLTLVKERAAVDSEMEVLSRLRREMEEQLKSVMTDKLEISYEKERMNKLRRDAESENQEIGRLQYELEVERKALSMARSWAEDEAKRAREQAKALEKARDRWESRGLKIVVDKDLREEEEAGVTWAAAGNPLEETVERSVNLVEKLKAMASEVSGKCKDTINKIIEKILFLISQFKNKAAELKDATKSNLDNSLQGVRQKSAEFTVAAKEGVKRVAGDWKDGVERLSQKFKT